MFRKSIQNKTELIKHLNSAVSLTYCVIFRGNRFASVYEFWWKARKWTGEKTNFKGKTKQNKKTSVSLIWTALPSVKEKHGEQFQAFREEGWKAKPFLSEKQD